jgi:membrane associated rhomboid family serine protease
MKMIDLDVTRSAKGALTSFRTEVRAIAVLVAIIWIVFLLSRVFPAITQWGLAPRRVLGLIGIFSMTFLHQNLPHIASNTIPLIVLLTLLAGSKASSLKVVIAIIVLGGTMLWIGGTRANHIGASLLIFGLITYLIATGLFEKKVISFSIAMLVGVLYGIPLIKGVLPDLFGNSNISWDGHLCGAVAGVIVAYFVERNGKWKSSQDSV